MINILVPEDDAKLNQTLCTYKGATVLEGITANYASDDVIQQWFKRIGMAK